MKFKPQIADTNRRTRWGTPNTAGVSIPHELSFENIGHQINGTDILSDISIAAPSGTVTCLLGPSGSGKTTLLRIAAGMEQPTSGTVMMDGTEISGPNRFVPPEKRGIGLVFQDYALFPHLSVMENVRFGLAHLRAEECAAQASQMLTRVGLEDRGNDYPHQLSGGEQQRVALARALAPRPGVLLMDEPFSGLDSRLRDMMREETLAMLRETRATSVIVTHDPEEALRMGDKIALLHDGKLEQTGTGRELFYQPESLFAAGFFSELNYFTGKVENGNLDTPLGTFAAGKFSTGDVATAAIRVGAIDVKAAGKAKAGISGRVLSAHFTGEHDYLQIGIAGSDNAVRARVRAGILPPEVLEDHKDAQLSVSTDGSFVFPALGEKV